MSKTPMKGKFNGPGTKNPVRRERRTKRQETFGSYLRQFLKAKYEGYGFTSAARRVLDGLINQTISDLSFNVDKLLKLNGRKTIRAQDVYDAVALKFGSDLGRQCQSDSESAIASALEAKSK